ncbi:autotransporter family protein [Stenotrophomonas rhizophila]
MNVLSMRVNTLCLAVCAALTASLAPMPADAAETVIIRDADVDLIQPYTYDHAEIYDSKVTNHEVRRGTAVSIDRGNLRMERTQVLTTGDRMSALSYYGGEYRNNGVTYDAVIEGSDFTTHGDSAFGLLFSSSTFDTSTGMVDKVGRISVRDSSVSTTGSGSAGLSVAGVNTVDLIISSVTTGGNGAHGAVMTGGTLAVQNSRLDTSGDDAHGVHATSERWSITGRPPFAYRADLTLVDSSVTTHGAGSVGILAGYAGSGDPEGIGADVRLDNASVRSAQSHAVQFLGGKENTLELVGGSVLEGGDAVVFAGKANSFSVVNASSSALIGRGAQALVADHGAELHVHLDNSEVQVAGGRGLAHARGDSRIDIHAVGSQLQGNVRVDADATLDMYLDGSTWDAWGQSQLDQLTLRNGSALMLGAGTLGDQMIVRGDLYVEDSALVFDSALGDDTSATDHLWVQGDTSGHGTIVVNNLAGRGGQTVDGIQLIQIDGVSGAALSLNGRAVGGQYEYFLFKGSNSDPTDGNWYLRSELQPVVDPCDADPTAVGCVDPDPTPDPKPDPRPEPVLRPEPGAYLGNQRSALQMFTLPAHALKGTGGPGAGGAWAAMAGSNARYGALAGQLRVRGDTASLQIGADVFSWGQGTRGALGVLLGSGRASTTSRSQVTGYSASGTVDGKVVGVYAQWRQSADGDRGMSVDGMVQHARFDNTVQGQGLGEERYNSRSTSAAVEAGYAFTLLDSPVRSVYVQPQVQLRYTDFTADAHTERNGTLIGGADAGGLSSRVGVRVYGHARTTDRNRVQPYVALDWIRESADNSLRFDGERVHGGLPRDRVEAAAGVQLRLGSRWSAWGDMGWQRGDGGYREVGATLGVRASW